MMFIFPFIPVIYVSELIYMLLLSKNNIFVVYLRLFPFVSST